MDETTLVIAAQTGDRDAFLALVRRYHGTLVASARQLTESMEDAEDAVQEAVISAYRHLSTLQEPVKFRAWLFAILRRACIDHRRKCHDNALPLDDCIDLPAPDATLDTLDYCELLARLPLVFREALIAHYFYELSYAEMAKVFAGNEKTMRTRCFRGRALMRLLAERDEAETRRILQGVMATLAIGCSPESFMARIARELPQLPPVSTRQLPPVAASHQLAGIIGAKLAVVKVAGMAFAVLGLAALVAGLLPHRSHHAHVRRAEAIRIAAAPVTRHTVQSRNTTARPVHSPHFPSSVAGQAVTHRTYMRLARTHSSMVKSSYSSPVQRDVMPLPVATRMAASTSTPPQAADTSATGQLLLMSLIMNVAPSAIKELGITSLGDK